ncbi:MAG: protein kinase family protein [Prevotella sp.]|nr:protein kinase family protein [Prevotella sp.]
MLWKFAREVASGLAYIHSLKDKSGNLRPVIHQDIKPANILIGDDDSFLITDFGISKETRATMRINGGNNVADFSLTTEYAGNERFPDSQNPYPIPVMASDIWSLGASLYELAKGALF